jgi:broad specificity phosphatase PhoE
MSEIYLIRHGQASFGTTDYDRLSPIGSRQADILADHLHTLGVRFDAVYSGRMQRQRDTAQPLCRRYGEHDPACGQAAILPAFDEYDAGALLKARRYLDQDADTPNPDAFQVLRRDKAAFQAYFAETVIQWVTGRFDHDTGIASWASFCARVAEGVQQIIRRHGRSRRMAVFTSGGPICAVLAHVLGLSRRTAIEISWQIMNTSWTCVKYRDSRLALSVFNNTTHLLLEKDPSLLTYR